MKKHLSKRLLSLLLAVVMVATSAPFVASAQTATISDEINYLFAYFTGDDSEQVRLAVSDDGYNFEALNGNNPVLDATLASNQVGVDIFPADSQLGIAPSGSARDPYIVKDKTGEGYYILATDLSAPAQEYRNSKMLVWHITDLSQADKVKPWAIETRQWFPNNYGGSGDQGTDTAGVACPDFYAWAPGAIWDADKEMYLLYWSAGRSGDPRNAYDTGNNSNYQTMGIYGCYTKDFKTFYLADGVTELKAGSYPILMYNPRNYEAIDAEIVEHNGTYYMWHKNEDNGSGDDTKYLVLASDTEITGGEDGYDWVKDFVDKDNPNYHEGPFVYQLPNGTYVLMADWYKNDYPNAEFIAYTGSTPADVQNNRVSNQMMINYLKPRHGKVTQITAAEYDTLVQTYGKVTYDGRNYFGAADDINKDTLVARYFVNDDIYTDATGHGFDLSGSLAVNYDADAEITYADFNGQGVANNPGGGNYATRDMSDMVTELTERAGFTISFYAQSDNSSSSDNRRLFELSTFDHGQWTELEQHGYIVNYSAADIFETKFGTADPLKTASSVPVPSDKWDLYTITVSENFLTLSVNGAVRRNTPIYQNGLSDDVFNGLKTGNLNIGISSWDNDKLFDGRIHDFRIYNRALSNDEVQASLDLLKNPDQAGVELPAITDGRIYYDPMEDTEIGGVTYNKYAQSEETTDFGTVLNTAGATVNANKEYSGAASENGYTLGFWVNPGAQLDNANIFNMNCSGTDFSVAENGVLIYGGASVSGIFGSSGLAADSWQYVTLQIIPNGNYETINTFINGEFISTVDTYRSMEHQGVTGDNSVADFLAKNGTVAYGGANCLIDDFAVYSNVYAAQDVFRENSIAHSETLLDSAIESYLQKMKGIVDQSSPYYGKAFTNMEAAYDAYNAACRYRDAVNKGAAEGKAEEYADAYANLVAATNAMQSYTKPQTKQGLSPSETQASATVSADYTKNMLSAVNLTAVHELVGGTQDNSNAAVYSGSFVWLYTGIDGDTMTAPINGGVYGNKAWPVSDTYSARSIYPNNSDFSFVGNWRASRDTSVADATHHPEWIYDTWQTLPNPGEMGSTTDSSTGIDLVWGGAFGAVNGYRLKWCNASNVLTWNAGASKFTTNGSLTDYYCSSEPDYYHISRKGNSDRTNEINMSEPIYVINFSRVNQALTDSDRLQKLANIDDYTPESAAALLEAYDDLTSQDYLFNSVSLASVENLATQLQTKVNDLEGIDLEALEPFADTTELEQAREEQTPFFESVVVDDTGAQVPESSPAEYYTDSSWLSYENAYNALIDYYTGLNPYGTDYQYATSEEQLATLVNNLNNSRVHLVVRADYTPAVTVTADGSDETAEYNLGNGTDYTNQRYTIGTWNAFTGNYEEAEYWADSPDQYKVNTPKNAIDFAKYGEVSGKTENQFPYVGVNVDENGAVSIVDDPSEITNKTVYIHFKSLGLDGFYDTADSDAPSQFETGQYIKYNGSMINLNGCRFAPNSDVLSQLSPYQSDINDYSYATVNSCYELAAVADYTVYDAATDLLNYQDLGAFADAEAKDAVFGILDEQGIKYGDKTYSTGVSASDSETVNTAEYVAGSEEKAYVVSGGTVWKNYSEKPESQAELDKYTQNVLETLEQVNTDVTGELRKTVTVNYSFKSSDGADIKSGTEEWFYGDGFTLTAPEGYHVYRWEVTDLANDKTMVLPAADSYYAQLTGDVSITAYCSTEQTEGTVVKIQNQYGNEIQQYVLAEGQQVSVGVRSYTVADETIELVDPPFYAFTGWSVNGTVYDAAQLPQNIDLSSAKDGVITLRPMYEVASGQYTVTVDGLTVAGISETNPGVEYVGVYDDSVTLFPEEGAYGIAAKIGDSYYAVSYGDTPYSFFLINDVELYAITDNGDGTFTIGDAAVDGDTAVKLAKKLPFAYAVGNTEAAAGKFTAYGATTAFVDEGVVSEVGIIFTRNADIGTDAESFVIGADGVTTAPAKNQLDTMQYGVRVSTADGSVVYARPYVKYTYTTENVSSENGSTVNDSTVIQTIEYGNIVSSN